MKIVILDTEVLKRDPKRIKGPFLALSKLAQNELIEIHLSEISVKEFLSDQKTKIEAVFSKAQTSLNSLYKQPISDDFLNSLTDLTKKIVTEKHDAFDRVSKDFDYWCEENSVKIDLVKEEHGNKVLEGYFSAAPPFKKLKNREDIPDAFIWENIFDLSQSDSQLSLLSGDNHLREACKKYFSNVTTYKDINSFLEKEGYISELRLGILETQLSVVFEHIVAFMFNRDSEIDDLIENELIGKHITIFHPFRGSCQISSIEKPIKVIIGDFANYYGDGLLSIPFSARSICKLKHIVNQDTLNRIKDKRELVITSLENDFSEIEISRQIVFAGSLLLGVKPSILEEEKTIDEIHKSLKNIETVLESLSVYGETNSQVTIDIYNQHAHEEALESIKAGDFDIELDAEEESTRTAMARWYRLPDKFAGQHGDLHIKEGAQVKIAPPPRFEEWVKVLKKTILEKQHDNKNEG